MSAPGSGPLARVRRELHRTNFASRRVSLGEGALVVAGTALLARRAGRADAAALGAIGLLGLADDVLEPRLRAAGHPAPKGLRGHLGLLRRGRLSTGAAKALGIPLAAGAAALAAPSPRGGALVLVDTALVAGTANLANLLDLRPGRALKAVLPGALLLAAVPAAGERARTGRALALAAAVPGALALPADLSERGMLGDAGANVLGAALGAAAARRLPAGGRLALLGVVTALTLASETVSFSAVIDRTPTLRRLDGLGRRRPPMPRAAEPSDLADPSDPGEPADAGDQP